jgi:predicted transcriptional regulator
MIEIPLKLKLSQEDLKSIAKEVAIINSPKNLKSIAKEQERQFTVSEIASMTSRSEWTVRKHITDDKILIASKVGKSWLISETNYKKYINNGE